MAWHFIDHDATGGTTVVVAWPNIRKKRKLCKLLFSSSAASPLSIHVLSPADNYPRTLTSYLHRRPTSLPSTPLYPKAKTSHLRSPQPDLLYTPTYKNTYIHTPKPAEQETSPFHQIHIIKASDAGQRGGSSQRQFWRTFGHGGGCSTPRWQSDRPRCQFRRPGFARHSLIPNRTSNLGRDRGIRVFDAHDVPRNGTPVQWKFILTKTGDGTEWKVEWFRTAAEKKANGSPVHLTFYPTRTGNGAE